MIIDSYIQGPKVRLHNQLILGMLYNSMRDPPPLEIAPWVSSTNKPSALAGAGGPGKGNADAHEARLKVEVMALAGRDRRRIKEIAEVRIFNTLRSCDPGVGLRL